MDKSKALEAAMAQIDRNFGKGTVKKLGENKSAIEGIDVVSTGSLSLDIGLGIGGLPKGRIVEIYGPESSGKTTLTLHVVAEAQKNGGTCAFVDMEHALDPSYATKIGVNIDDLLVSQPDHGEQALEITDTLVRSGAIDVLVIDSVAALVPKDELEGEMGELKMGLQARLMSQALRKLTSSVSRSNCLVIFINQIRMKIGVMFGNPETTTGGNSLKFYSSVRLDIRRIGAVKDRDDVVGNSTKVKVVKNKMAPPFKEVKFDIMYNEGISKTGELLDLGEAAGVVEKSGSWYSYKDTRIGQGRENSKQYLVEHPEIAEEIENIIRENSGIPTNGKTKGTKALADEKASESKKSASKSASKSTSAKSSTAKSEKAEKADENKDKDDAKKDTSSKKESESKEDESNKDTSNKDTSNKDTSKKESESKEDESKKDESKKDESKEEKKGEVKEDQAKDKKSKKK